ncbi:MAG TPA: hypothetical protein VFH28_04235 [Nitrososphaera sp.]|nr:hypothetical protein [Nitrososphaera sp.]
MSYRSKLIIQVAQNDEKQWKVWNVAKSVSDLFYIYAGEVRDNTKKTYANTKRNFLHLDSRTRSTRMS